MSCSPTTIRYGYKFSRKKDKRKFTFKHCVLRAEKYEMIIPFAKGDFTWVASKKHGGGNYDR